MLTNTGMIKQRQTDKNRMHSNALLMYHSEHRPIIKEMYNRLHTGTKAF